MHTNDVTLLGCVVLEFRYNMSLNLEDLLTFFYSLPDFESAEVW